ncbi:hypothetical protein PoB_003519400 [Plakobranchus ocellatus]|uniref:Uncharacterized protein n=1 Tax=Plakobranchus ocellatus TaxID=259542 RepID=A0AAV4ALR6_9GAST|nr:hypothetical protein PoB_003519400 [Plakobranchus ocellatus]
MEPSALLKTRWSRKEVCPQWGFGGTVDSETRPEICRDTSVTDDQALILRPTQYQCIVYNISMLSLEGTTDHHKSKFPPGVTHVMAIRQTSSSSWPGLVTFHHQLPTRLDSY